MTTPKELENHIAALLAEREVIRKRNKEIARRLHMLRVRLSRTPLDGDEITSQGNTIAPLDYLDLVVGDTPDDN